ncbi:MAG: hypothetical protein JSU66_01550 [Deltaproteobacteria bacterium]|nr:MAG: hypothetical protein JSU66_01550 [Deltaproteobacteria bacterium]
MDLYRASQGEERIDAGAEALQTLAAHAPREARQPRAGQHTAIAAARRTTTLALGAAEEDEMNADRAGAS